MRKGVTYFFLILFLAVGELSAQEDDKKVVKRQSIADRKKELAEKKAKQKAEDAAAVEELKQMHYDNQDKKTQKRMKKSAKKANKANSGKKGISLRTLFNKRGR